MDRRSFLKLAAAGPALVSPYASATVIGSQTRAPQTDFTFYSPLAEEWYRSGEYFEWTSTTPNNEGRRVNVFYRTFGNRANPALLILHGYPTSSFDFREMIPFLEEDYFVAVLDFPGFGFSTSRKTAIRTCWRTTRSSSITSSGRSWDCPGSISLTHDRGGSVGFAFLGNYLAREERAYEITYTSYPTAGSFWPLANLSPGQYAIQDAVRGPELIRAQQARPRVTEGTPRQVAYADIQAFNDGIGARLYVGSTCLSEQRTSTAGWTPCARARSPTALIWGLLDTVNPPRIGNHIWYNYLDKRAAESSYWLLPTANHYCNATSPEEMAGIVRTCLEVASRRRGRERVMRTLARNRTATSPRLHGSLPSSRTSTSRGPSRTRRTDTVSEAPDGLNICRSRSDCSEDRAEPHLL